MNLYLSYFEASRWNFVIDTKNLIASKQGLYVPKKQNKKKHLKGIKN